MPYTPPYGTHRLRRARTTRSGPTGEFFFLSIVFFKSNYTHSLWMSPRHRHAIYFTHTAPTGCVGPERLVRALQVSFFFLLLFFLILTTPTACVCHRHAIYFTHTAPTACVGPKRLVWALQVSFFFLLFFFYF